MKAAIVAAAIGGGLAVVEGLLLIENALWIFPAAFLVAAAALAVISKRRELRFASSGE